MNDEERFLQGMWIDCDEGLRLIFSDWLEDQGDGRGPVLRGSVVENRLDVPLLNYYDKKQRILDITYGGIMYHYVVFSGEKVREVRINYSFAVVTRDKPYILDIPKTYSWQNQSAKPPERVARKEENVALFLRVAIKYWRNGQWWPRIEGYKEGNPYARQRRN
jgi:uncharacterized protein (TIGR02996 family)